MTSPYLVPDSRIFSYQSPVLNVEANGMATPQHSQLRVGTKSEKQRMMLGRTPQTSTKVHTAAASQQSFALSASAQPASTRSGALSPRAMGASATRFIRRVASAPNAKHLFSSGSRSSATTKNGLLAPADVIPPVPGVPSTSSDLGDDSLETLSSGSSRGRGNRHDRYGGNAHLSKTRIVNGVHDGPGKMAFRRTYSSNSIKVRQVSYRTCQIDCFLNNMGESQVEVGPSSFLKIKMLGKGDVGRVYLVREKKTDKLFAMKGRFRDLTSLELASMIISQSSPKKR